MTNTSESFTYAVCSECREPVVNEQPTRFAVRGVRPAWSHPDGEPLCPTVGRDGYEPAQPTEGYGPGVPSQDDLPVTATYDLTGVSPSEYGTGDATTAQVRVTQFVSAPSGRIYARIVWQEQEFAVPLADLMFD